MPLSLVSGFPRKDHSTDKSPGRAGIILLALIPAAILVLAFIAYRDTNTLEVTKYRLCIPRLSVLKGIRIAFLSDLHSGSLGWKEERLLEVLAREKPDLILLGGDYIRHKGSYAPCLEFFSKLNAPLGVYGVLGNMEYTNENGSCVLCHRNGSWELREHAQPLFLKNQSVPIRWNGNRVNLIGLDDPVDKRRKNLPNHDLDKALAGVDRSIPSILIVHSPESFSEAAAAKMDLVLSGHTHGGQISFVKYIYKALGLDAALEYPEGFFTKGNTALYVSRGIGMSVLPFRIGVRPEITFFEVSGTDGNRSGPGTMECRKLSRERITAEVSGRLAWETFDFASYVGKRRMETPGVPSRHDPVLFDFEDEDEMRGLNHECGKRLERVSQHAVSGTHSLRARIPAGRYQGIRFSGFRPDWSGALRLQMNVHNPNRRALVFFVRIDDRGVQGDPRRHYDRKVILHSGDNLISIPIESIRSNSTGEPLDYTAIESIQLYAAEPGKPVEFYMDYIRLEE